MSKAFLIPNPTTRIRSGTGHCAVLRLFLSQGCGSGVAAPRPVSGALVLRGDAVHAVLGVSMRGFLCGAQGTKEDKVVLEWTMALPVELLGTRRARSRQVHARADAQGACSAAARPGHGEHCWQSLRCPRA
eukprot:1361767-Rhodomonas_salina.1